METKINKNTIENTKEFKSYYVVWKPCKDNYSNFENTSLNRTMQYGNLRVPTNSHISAEV